MKLKTLLFVTFNLIVQLTVFAQKRVTGVVSDATTKEPLIGASVVIKGTTKGSLTDLNGAFSLDMPDDATSLVVSFIGYNPQTIVLSKNMTSINVALNQGSTLNEVVVTALGIEEKRSQLSYATQRVDAAQLNVSRLGDLSQQLSGMVPGLNITTGNGSGVSSSRILLRGESSLNINKNQPLIIIDGVVVSNNLDGFGGNSNAGNNMPVDYGNGMTDFNTDDIKDVSVLKGPKAAALYGSRAANGALVIRTKSGLEKKGLGIEINSGVSADKLGNFWDEQTQYGGGFDNVFRADWGGNYGAPTNGASIKQPTAYQNSNKIDVEAKPFLKRLDRRGFFDTGVSYNNNLAVSFSKDNGVWGRISVAQLDRTGILPNTEYKRRNIGLRMGADVSDKLQVEVSANYVNSFSDNLPVIGGGGEGVINNMFWGMNNYDYNDYKNYWLPGQEGVAQNYFMSWATNPLLIMNENLNAFNRNRIFGNIKATYKITDNLSFFVRAGTDFYSDLRNSRRPTGQPNFARGMYRENNVRFNENNIDFLMNYRTKLSEKIGLNTSAGANRMDQTNNSDLFEARVLGVPFVYNRGNVGGTPLTNSYNAKKRINSTYATAQLDFDQKIFVDVTGRNDWSSSLPLGSNSFFYPSVGMSTLLTKVLKLPEVISYAQLRANWATTGNDTDPLLTEKVLSFGTLPSSVSNPALLINPELRPEITSAREIGAEINFFKNRLGIDFNVYHNITRDQILQVPISQSSGATSRLINAGKVQNKGVEVFLKGNPVATQNFSWDVSLAWARNRNEVLELTEGVSSFVIAQGPAGGTVEARPGGRMGDMYGRGFARSPQGDVILDVVKVGGVDIVRPRTSTNIQYLGNYLPDWTAGLTNSFTYKGVNLKVLLDYRSGGILYTNTGALLYRSGIVTETLPFREEKFVPEGVIQKADGTFEKNTISTTGQDWYRSKYPEVNIEANSYDATYLKLREMSVGVDLKRWVKVKGMEKLNLSAFGRNLFVHTKSNFLRHFDPEALALSGSTMLPGFEVGQLPNPRTYGFNLNIGF